MGSWQGLPAIIQRARLHLGLAQARRGLRSCASRGGTGEQAPGLVVPAYPTRWRAHKDPAWRGKSRGLGVQTQWSKPAGTREATVRAHTWGRGWGRASTWPALWAHGAGPGPLHLVTRSASKALMPWAALSRASSLAGGPCQKTVSRCTPRCATCGAAMDSVPALSPLRQPGPRAAASTGRRREGCRLEQGAGTLGLDTATSVPPWPPPKDTPHGLICIAEAGFPFRSGGPDSNHWAWDF